MRARWAIWIDNIYRFSIFLKTRVLDDWLPTTKLTVPTEGSNWLEEKKQQYIAEKEEYLSRTLPFFPNEAARFAAVFEYTWYQICFQWIVVFLTLSTITLLFWNYVLYQTMNIPVEMPIIGNGLNP